MVVRFLAVLAGLALMGLAVVIWRPDLMPHAVMAHQFMARLGALQTDRSFAVFLGVLAVGALAVGGLRTADHPSEAPAKTPALALDPEPTPAPSPVAERAVEPFPFAEAPAAVAAAAATTQAASAEPPSLEPSIMHDEPFRLEPQVAEHAEAPAPTAVLAPAASTVRRSFDILTEAGDSERMKGNDDDALEHYTVALDLARDAHSVSPHSTEAITDLAAALTNVGDIYDEQGRIDSALRAHEESLALRRELASRAPDDRTAQRALSLGLERLADTREARGHRTRALDLYRESLPIAERLAGQYPHDALLSKDLIITRENIAELEAKLA
jgi:tetratricopeptide (TPR) repeat protein